jgi:superfamily II RNA helicase
LRTKKEVDSTHVMQKRAAHSMKKKRRSRSMDAYSLSGVSFQPTEDVRALLELVGEPTREPFRPDPFQLEALEALNSSDVLVCAPTGAGKTWIAVEALESHLRAGRRCWYASPLKALSNSKYEEFILRFGAQNVGILTGDRKENPNAPIIVGTTEILRNHLYEAMDLRRELNLDFVVLDEAHYLADQDRGVVWEETLIYLPSRVRILLLSATVGNPKVICQWLETIRGVPCSLVEERRRPVPLYTLFLRPDGRLMPLVGRRGLLRPVRKFIESRPARANGSRSSWSLPDIVEGLRGLDLLPAIFFLKSRAECDRAVESFPLHPAPRLGRTDPSDVLEPLLKEFPYLRNHRHMRTLLEYRVAAHHAGQLPQWKLLVERMMNAGHLDAIFSTSTVAAGVDFPARTVVLVQSDRFDGQQFTALTATEFRQMTGRAGRRGKDRVGFALIVPGPYQDLHWVARLTDSEPDPIESQIHINFSMVLNLLLSHRPEEIRELLSRSLAAFQGAKVRTSYDDQRVAASPSLNGRSAVVQMERRRVIYLKEALRPGRLFLDNEGDLYVSFGVGERAGKPICRAHKLSRRPKARKGRLVVRSIPISRIQRALETSIEVSEHMDPRELAAMVKAVIREGRLEGPAKGGGARRETEHAPAGRRSSGAQEGLWRDFLRHLEFLRESGFVDSNERLTADGRWASNLRLDHPIVVAEAIRRGVFDHVGPEVMAGLMAPFVLDRDKEVHVWARDLKEIEEAYSSMVASTFEMMERLEERGFAVPMLPFWPSAALYLWAKGVSWGRLLSTVPMDEGDMVSLILRTADHLRQVADLKSTHPRLAATAHQAIEMIQRDPVC